jgi:hypothetical protein
MTKRYCDICGRPIGFVAPHFKLDQHYYGMGTSYKVMPFRGFDEEVCPRCASHIRRFVKAMKCRLRGNA